MPTDWDVRKDRAKLTKNLKATCLYRITNSIN